MTIYKKAAERREDILTVACDLAETSHYRRVRRSQLVERCGTAAGNISRVMGSMETMRSLLIDFALRNNRPKVVAQAILDNHPAVSHLAAAERSEFLAGAV